MGETDEELIAKFIRERGVTKCPTGVCAPTTGIVVDAETALAHAERGIDPAGEAWRQRIAASRKRGSQRGWAAYWAKKKAAQNAKAG